MKAINRTIEKTTIQFKAYSFEDKTLFDADAEGYEISIEELTAEVEKRHNCKVLEIVSQITKRYKLAIDIHKAIEVGTIEEID